MCQNFPWYKDRSLSLWTVRGQRPRLLCSSPFFGIFLKYSQVDNRPILLIPPEYGYYKCYLGRHTHVICSSIRPVRILCNQSYQICIIQLDTRRVYGIGKNIKNKILEFFFRRIFLFLELIYSLPNCEGLSQILSLPETSYLYALSVRSATRIGQEARWTKTFSCGFE